jgi:threonine aldolase
VETPSRRLHNRRFGRGRIGEVTALAKAEGIPTFLDGARMLMEAAWHEEDPAEIAAPFDLVYLSLYKFLDAPFGCVLAGRADLLEAIHHDRRRHGGSLWEMWPAAVLAGAALPRMETLWPEVRAAADEVFDALGARGLPVELFADGTNVVRLPLPPGAPDGNALAERAKANGLKLPPAAGGALPLKANASWLRTAPQDLAARVASALGR